MTEDLFTPFKLGDLTLSNRMVMAPMTRNRAQRDGTVTSMMVKHYRDRANSGLIISESVPVSPEGIGYPFTPGLFTEDQSKSWRVLTDAVHEKGGKVFAQLQHCGRISHPALQPGGILPVAPSAIQPDGEVYTYEGPKTFVTPAALDANGIRAAVDAFANGAALAKRAGFDGVEVHGANGYLIDQFLRDGSNQRQDAYGGNVAGRMKFLNEVLDEVLQIWHSSRVGLRLTPENSFNSMSDSDPQMHFEYFAGELRQRNLAYLHILEGDMMSKESKLDYRRLKGLFSGPYIANNGYDRDKAEAALQSGNADLVAFGMPFLANPDLVDRYKRRLPLNEADPSTFYGGDEKGYNDYPAYSKAEVELV